MERRGASQNEAFSEIPEKLATVDRHGNVGTTDEDEYSGSKKVYATPGDDFKEYVSYRISESESKGTEEKA